ncbi:protein serine/threonine phosphatase 2C [Pholiota conissans]|uniref:Protein serine/threonine phosphatase 2C n=1 Tax=Pholiota conissans TaxID=109636 RepID=A0A9P6D379_9AGAR|nr:protein serine/threonine phosphatase 2C [Pholiota conissans]
MLRRAWKPVAVTVVIGAPAYYYYKTRYNAPQTFDFPIRIKGPSGKSEMVTRSFPLLPMKELDARIQENATSESHVRPDGTSWKYTTANLASNSPIEDAHSNQIVGRDVSDPSAPGDYLFFSVMDGHGGYETSRLLSRVLIQGVALELSKLIEDPKALAQSGLLNRLRSILWLAPSKAVKAPLDADPGRVSQAIENAFVNFDNELLQAPLRVLANNISPEDYKTKTVPDLSQHPLSLTTMLPAISGICALMAIFDTAHHDLYVACVGDSRAVAGVWQPTSNGQGQWRIEVLSEDQTGRNPSEIARIQSEHPKDEEDYVIREGRVLGGLEPSRAFGDARYKWPRAVQDVLSEAFMVGNGKPLRPPPALFKSPPYVTARPVVTHRKMSLSSTSGPETLENTKRFLVLATDGLWDQLSNEEVVGLVGGHLSSLKGKISKSDLPNLVPTASGSQGVNGKKERTINKEGSWTFTDSNISAHLIRNAFGGGDEQALRRMLSIPPPHSRRYRDDVTVTVICWEDGNEAQAEVFTKKVKSKL